MPLEGSPAEIGFQNGFHLALEINELQKILALQLKHDTGKDYAFFRAAVEKRLRPKIEPKYRGRACGEEREVGSLGRGGGSSSTVCRPKATAYSWTECRYTSH